MRRLRTIFMGTPDFSIPALELLSIHPAIELIQIISMPDRPKGRGMEQSPPPVIEFAQEKKLPYFQTENINKEDLFLARIEEESVDLIIVLAFAQFLSQKILDLPKLGCFNIHTSLLPKYRGAAPIQHALLNGDKISGVSIQKMVKKMDAGDLVHSYELPISPHESCAQLYTRLKFQAASSLNTFIEELLLNKIIYTAQDESLVSYAPTLKKEDGMLDFKKKSAEEIINQVRALNPWPSTYCYINKKRVKILHVSLFTKKLAPGVIDISLGQLLVGCKEGTLHLHTIQCEGKRVCLDREFLNGCKETPSLTGSDE